MTQQAVVFDFDGVIADSEPLHCKALQLVSQSVGMCLSSEQFQANCVGKGDDQCWPIIAKLNNLDEVPGIIAELSKAKSEHVIRLTKEGVERGYGGLIAHRGSVELIHQAAGHVPVAVCTGSRRCEIEPMLRELGVLDVIGAFVTADDVALPKPDPAEYLLVAEQLGVRPESCTAIEDTPTGIAAAVGAGYGRVIGVCHTMAPEHLGEAHRVIERLEMLSIEDVI